MTDEERELVSAAEAGRRHAPRTVAVLEEYVPSYRVPFFSELKKRATRRGITVLVCAGEANRLQAARGDSNRSAIDVVLRQREYRALGRRVVLRQIPDDVRSADLLISNQARRNLDLYWWLLRPRRLRKRKIAVWGHGTDHVESKSGVDGWLMGKIAQRADWLFAYTEAGAEAASRWTHRVSVVNNSTDTASLRRDLSSLTPDERADFAENHRLGSNVVLFVGGLDGSKRLDALLEASRYAAARIDGFTCMIAGEGPLKDDLERAGEESPHLRILGHMEGKDLAAAMAAADFMVVPGRVGLVAVDALTAGLPVITLADSHHAPEFAYLHPGSTTIACSTVAEMGVTVVELFQDRPRLEVMRTACLQDATDFSVETMADNFLEGIVAALDQT